MTLRLDGRRVLVTGLGVSGLPAARALLRLGADVVAVDGADGPAQRDAAVQLAGADVRLGDADDPRHLEGAELVVTSPGWRPTQPLLAGAARRGVPVWGEVELAWRLRGEGAAPWLAVTGTNGKTTAVRMLASVLAAAGRRTVAVGNVGAPLVDAVLDGAYDVLAVELSSYQLHWTSTVAVQAGAVLNVAPDHLDWHGGLAAYAADKGLVYRGAERACVYNAADPVTEQLVRDADVAEGARAVGTTLCPPAPAQLGLVEDLLVDRAFDDDGGRPDPGAAVELATTADVVPLAPHVLEDALAAAALARAHGVPAAAVRDGLRAFRPDAHRIAHVADLDGVAYVDDSKATNAHAAQASLRAYDPVVWVAGGLAKGATFDELVRAAAPRLRGVVLLGRDREALHEPLRRHAPQVPVIVVERTDTGAMDDVVSAAAGLARPGDTVLLAPACASMDMFRDYGARGDAFADAVLRRAASGGPAPR
ncbi:UDP-N-acetylmuramoyl-L-alanine--D-glutamate ligase [Vallicoccus soli]|uniref:UDP-N-acetylmuramoyl-L-alanine--D-glutamate ligase n=1 Tax=Vallicoccus soli TaxID=2339232 RepID=UPI001FE4D7E7|nr:UDP-N-acetylmuramoyl-L-alanine--D-glutamate ligase [Vallicoccus soli]